MIKLSNFVKESGISKITESKVYKIEIINKNGKSTIHHLPADSMLDVNRTVDLLKKSRNVIDVKILGIKDKSSVKETPNPKETPVISFGNEKRETSTMPSLQMQDMAAMEEEMCNECGGEMTGGYCSQCGEEPQSGDGVWGNPTEDHESMMARGELKDMISNASKIYNMIEPGTELPGWVSAYITLASDYMHSVAEYAAENAKQ
jgi:hypothetical protein